MPPHKQTQWKDTTREPLMGSVLLPCNWGRKLFYDHYDHLENGMMLFDKYPVLEDECICMRRMTLDDADALLELTQSESVYRYEPTVLYELRYDDKRTVIERMDDECFKTHESLLLGVYVGEGHNTFAGIAEVYDYNQETREAYIGGRLHERHWGQGIATHIIVLLKEYLFSCENIQTIRTHVMAQNAGSEALMRKCGFIPDGETFMEDWGHGPVSTHSYYVSKS